MYNVLLVDDEENVIKSLKLSIPWERLGLSVVSTACGGKQALEVIEKTPIDIVISDIRMPGMDGLAFCNELFKKNKRCQAIIISGYAEFEYAKQCIDLGVKGYCLKPIDPNEMITRLNQAKLALKAYDNILPEDFISNIDYQNIPGIKNYLYEHGFLHQEFYLTVAIGIEFQPQNTKDLFCIKLGSSIFAYLSKNILSMEKMFEKHIKDETRCFGVGYDIYPAKYSNLKQSINQCMVRAYQFFITGKSGVWKQVPDSYGKKIVKDLGTFSKKEDPTKFIKLLQSLISRDCERMFNIKTAYSLYHTVISHHSISNKTEDLIFYSFDQLVAEYGSFKKMLKHLIILFSSTQSEADKMSDSPSHILSILQYINTNYNKEISLQTMSDELHLSKNYISQLFKKETGFSYSKYLTELRIEKSKELLLYSDLQISDICEAIGFNDYFYFIKAFKKEVGSTPNQFRNQHT